MKPTPDKEKEGDSFWFAWFGGLFGNDTNSKTPSDPGSFEQGAADSTVDSGSADAGGADGGGGGD